MGVNALNDALWRFAPSCRLGRSAEYGLGYSAPRPARAISRDVLNHSLPAAFGDIALHQSMGEAGVAAAT
jgi:hypothetical protein